MRHYRFRTKLYDKSDKFTFSIICVSYCTENVTQKIFSTTRSAEVVSLKQLINAKKFLNRTKRRESI